jgi:hypothetical protein
VLNLGQCGPYMGVVECCCAARQPLGHARSIQPMRPRCWVARHTRPAAGACCRWQDTNRLRV